ncbi:protein brambleberry-like isoform X3 [Ptychodera flava]|uniref:protein brambleberry-like isoform X3 n=1 Tax=Ptychodera flava TaxID=63121 RepID=UPI00396A3338
MFKSHLILFLYMSFNLTSGFLWWSSGENQSGSKEHDVPAHMHNGRAPFEMKTVDEKFIASAQQYLSELSELDVCHHKVVSQLKSSCNDINEEEVSKLGVALLNCQSQAEGRQTYTCTEDMGIGECTSGMDSNTWNAYHIISNRVRAVCYSARQQQFQYRTQHAVNQLAMTAEQQLHHVKQLQDSHEDLQESTDKVIEKMANGQEELMSEQEKLKSEQHQLQKTIAENIRALTDEKAVVAAGHMETARKTEYLKRLLENTNTLLMMQGVDSRTQHKQLMDDLLHIRDKASEIWHRIDESSREVMTYQSDTAIYYQHTMENLKKMNDTANHILDFLDSMQNEFDRKFGWITNRITVTGDSLNVVLTCVTHTLYFIITCILVTFLQTPVFSRIVLLIIVPLNAISKINHQKHLDFIALSWFITLVISCNWFYIFVYSLLWRRKSTTITRIGINPQSPCNCGFTSPWKPLAEKENDSVMSAVVKETISQEVKHYMKVLLDGWSQDKQEPDSPHSHTMETTYVSSSSIADHTTISNLLNFSALNSSLQDSMAARVDRHSTLLSSTTPTQDTPSNSVSETPTLGDTTPMPAFDENVFNETQASRTPDMVKRQLGQFLDDVSMETTLLRERRSSTSSSVRTSTSVNSTGTPRRPCHGLTKSGLPCRRSAMRDQDYCATHQPNN